MATNIGYKYYKEYFSQLKIDQNGIPTLDTTSINQNIYNYHLSAFSSLSKFFEHSYINDNTLKLTTLYPGLLIGSGYIHEIGSDEKDYEGEYLVKNELKLGFFFDHTTGLPILPGSTVKGMLRSAFAKATDKINEKSNNKASLYIQELLKNITGNNWTLESIYNLEMSIFEGEEGQSQYKRDVFFDAFPLRKEDDENKFLGNDYITPHKSALENPNPIQFLKILPQVTFQFNFHLQDFKWGEIEKLTASNKSELFKQILLDLGIGAKTNVGYGQFEFIRPQIIRLPETITRKQREKLTSVVNGEYNAKVVEMNDNDYLFEIENFDNCKIRKSIDAVITKFKRDAEKRKKRDKSFIYKNLEVGTEIRIRINRQTGDQLNFTVLPIWR
jgi:CRISPR-associated protein Cmr6